MCAEHMRTVKFGSTKQNSDSRSAKESNGVARACAACDYVSDTVVAPGAEAMCRHWNDDDAAFPLPLIRQPLLLPDGVTEGMFRQNRASARILGMPLACFHFPSRPHHG
jgi:hypothetical protein